MFPGPPLRSALGIPVLRGGAEPSSSSHRKPSKTHASAGTSAWPLPWWAVGRTWWGALHSLLFPRAEPTGFSRSSFMSPSHVKTRTTLGQEQEMICARQGEVCAPRKQEPEMGKLQLIHSHSTPRHCACSSPSSQTVAVNAGGSLGCSKNRTL